MLHLGKSRDKLVICELGSTAVNQALEPFLSSITIPKRAQEIGICLPLSAIAECNCRNTLVIEVIRSLLNIIPCLRELVVSSFLPHCLVIDDNRARSTGQHREAVDLVTVFEWCEIILLIILIIWRSLNDIGQIHDLSLGCPLLGIHSLEKEDIRKIARSRKRCNLCLVFCIRKNVLLNTDIRMCIFPRSQCRAESIRSAIRL